MIGERGGTVATFAEAQRLIEYWKGDWSVLVRETICEALRSKGEYHADDLHHLNIPAEHKNTVGSATAWLVNRRWMVEVGRRRTTAPASKSRKSGVYALTDRGRWELGDNSAVPENPDYRVDENGCWIWQKRLNHQGYGQSKLEGHFKAAHRVYFERAIGPIPDGLVLDHLCRNRACVNPSHLEPVTPAENNRRGLQRKLTWAQAREIRNSTGRCRDVAAQYGVTAMVVSKIRRNLSWRIEEDPAEPQCGVRLTKLRSHQITGESLGGLETASRGSSQEVECLTTSQRQPSAATSGRGADTPLGGNV
jgi:hypothetical protein